MLLYNESVENLHGPILAPHAIADNTAECRLAGNTNRTKVCHFVRARILSTFHFLSIRSNRNETSILLNRSFERMAFLTTHLENSWIKPVFNTIQDQFKAEQEFQKEIFYFVYEKLVEYKDSINRLHLQSQIQTNLQKYLDDLPILIQFGDFQRELHNPRQKHSSLNILRYVLDSTDFLQMTKWISSLSEFYLLLHQTYTQLIEKEEFHSMSLEDLYHRGEKYLLNDHQQKKKNCLLIIDQGIEAVNAYHQFTDGLIRPGVCDRTQRFSEITRQTPVHYLLTTSNHDEGNIISRILK